MFDPKSYKPEPNLLADRVILVTGASGLLGRSLAARLQDLGAVTGVGHSNTTGTLLSADLREAGALESLVAEAIDRCSSTFRLRSVCSSSNRGPAVG